MARFLLRRIGLGLLVLFAISVVVFVLFFVSPHDVARQLGGRQASPETLALINQRLGLNDPVLLQYWHFLSRLFHGDLGFSYYSQLPVTSILANALPVTLSLVLGAAGFWLLLGVFNGVLSATRPRSFADRALTTFSLIFYSMPTFLLGLLLLYFLYYRLTVTGVTSFFPPGGYAPLTTDPSGWLHHMILPWITLALVLAATYTRLTRGAMLDVLSEDYIRTARAKGLRERRVVYRHGLRSALTPVVTQFGIDLGALLGGVIVTEKVFSLDGLGSESLRAINQQDLPIVIAVVLLAAAAIVVANILVDVAYALLDPRVRLN